MSDDEQVVVSGLIVPPPLLTVDGLSLTTGTMMVPPDGVSVGVVVFKFASSAGEMIPEIRYLVGNSAHGREAGNKIRDAFWLTSKVLRDKQKNERWHR